MKNWLLRIWYCENCDINNNIENVAHKWSTPSEHGSLRLHVGEQTTGVDGKDEGKYLMHAVSGTLGGEWGAGT